MNTNDLRAAGISSAEAIRNTEATLAHMREAFNASIMGREPGPFAFVRSADEIAADEKMLADDLRDEHDDGSWRDRDDA